MSDAAAVGPACGNDPFVIDMETVIFRIAREHDRRCCAAGGNNIRHLDAELIFPDDIRARGVEPCRDFSRNGQADRRYGRVCCAVGQKADPGTAFKPVKAADNVSIADRDHRRVNAAGRNNVGERAAALHKTDRDAAGIHVLSDDGAGVIGAKAARATCAIGILQGGFGALRVDGAIGELALGSKIVADDDTASADVVHLRLILLIINDRLVVPCLRASVRDRKHGQHGS